MSPCPLCQGPGESQWKPKTNGDVWVSACGSCGFKTMICDNQPQAESAWEALFRPVHDKRATVPDLLELARQTIYSPSAAVWQEFWEELRRVMRFAVMAEMLGVTVRTLRVAFHRGRWSDPSIEIVKRRLKELEGAKG